MIDIESMSFDEYQTYRSRLIDKMERHRLSLKPQGNCLSCDIHNDYTCLDHKLFQTEEYTDGIDSLLRIYVPVFNEQQIMEGDDDLCVTVDNATKDSAFICWLAEAANSKYIDDDDKRDRLLYLLTDEVECLKCEYVWTEIEFLSLCPKCGNDDVQQTIYLTKEEV